jgi:Ca2+-binding RTX toxin-like protein
MNKKMTLLGTVLGILLVLLAAQVATAKKCGAVAEEGVCRGTDEQDELRGTDSDDISLGLGGGDEISGNDGKSGGRGADLIVSDDSTKDSIRCGRGKDTVTYDKGVDKIKNCEHRDPITGEAPTGSAPEGE